MENNKFVVPKVKACHYVNCSPDVLDKCDRHNSVCWVERSSGQNAPSDQPQLDSVGHENEGYPNINVQKLQGRKLAMLVLHALDDALDRWKASLEQNKLPLPNEQWHVGPAYSKVREVVRNLGFSDCDHLLRHVVPNICQMEMHVRYKC